MASCSFFGSKTAWVVLVVIILSGLCSANNNEELYPEFYSESCPELPDIIKFGVHSAIAKETRMGASLLRLFFHDCFVNVRNLCVH